MKLSLEQIKNLTVGAVEIWEEENGLHFGKCTSAQIRAWAEIDAGLVNNAKPTTGVRLDFHTDACFLVITVAESGKYELKVDGVLLKQYEIAPDLCNGEIRVELGKAKKERRITFVLPSHFKAGVIKSVAVEDGAFVKPHKFDRKILFVGDSITQGYNSVYNTTSYAYQVSEFLNAESVIQGVGGSRFEPTTVLSTGFTPDIVFIAYGTNDFHSRKSLQELEIAANAYMSKIREVYSGAKLFVISPVWRMDESQPREMGSFKACCGLIKEVAKAHGAEVVNGEKLLPQISAFMADSIHPNDLGFSAYTLNLLKEIKGKY